MDSPLYTHFSPAAYQILLEHQEKAIVAACPPTLPLEPLIEDLANGRGCFTFHSEPGCKLKNLHFQKLKRMFHKLCHVPLCRKVIEILTEQGKKISVVFFLGDPKNRFSQIRHDIGNRALYIDLHPDIRFYSFTLDNNSHFKTIKTPLYITFFHELIHCLRLMAGISQTGVPSTVEVCLDLEEEETIFGAKITKLVENPPLSFCENLARQSAGLPFRVSHHGMSLPKGIDPDTFNICEKFYLNFPLETFEIQENTNLFIPETFQEHVIKVLHIETVPESIIPLSCLIYKRLSSLIAKALDHPDFSINLEGGTVAPLLMAIYFFDIATITSMIAKSKDPLSSRMRKNSKALIYQNLRSYDPHNPEHEVAIQQCSTLLKLLARKKNLSG